MCCVYFKQVGKTKDVRHIIKEVVDRLAKVEAEVNPVESIDYAQIIRSNNDRIVYVGEGRAELNAVVLDPALKNYQMPYEPDGDKLTMWLKFQGLTTADGRLTDFSGFTNHAVIISGSPTGASGPVTGLPSVQFDGVDDTISIPNHTSINTQGLSTGFSINFNINPTQVNAHGGMPRVIAAKTDDNITARHQGWAIWIEPNGTLYFHVRIANIFYTASKTFAFPSLNKWYRVFCTFDRVALIPRIYVNGVLSTETTSTYVGSIYLPNNSTSLYVGSLNDTEGQAHFSGFLSDFRYWREKIITQTEIDNIQLNDYTISYTLYPGRVGVGNFASTDVVGTPGTAPDTPPPEPTPVHTLKSYTNTSYTTTSYMPA